MEALCEREALRRIRTRDVAALAQIERELFEVEEQLAAGLAGCQERPTN